jgi:hypothetical protein
MLGDGRLHLSGIERLGPHLTARNRDTLLRRATHKSKREIEELVAELAPRPDVRPTMRKLAEPRPRTSAPPARELRPAGVSTGRTEPPAGATAAVSVLVAARSPVVEPLGQSRYKVSFMATAELHEKLKRLEALMRSSVPDVDLAKVIDVAVSRELERVEARRFGKTKKPRKRLSEADTTPSSRHIPVPVRRAVHPHVQASQRAPGRARLR